MRENPLLKQKTTADIPDTLVTFVTLVTLSRLDSNISVTSATPDTPDTPDTVEAPGQTPSSCCLLWVLRKCGRSALSVKGHLQAPAFRHRVHDVQQSFHAHSAQVGRSGWCSVSQSSKYPLKNRPVPGAFFRQPAS